MEISKVKINEVKLNPINPRVIKDDKFKKLVESIKTFPEMLQIRPIVVNEDKVILGGNMRYKACKEAGLKEVYIIEASQLSEEQQREFIIKDNVGFGEWEFDVLKSDWDNDLLSDWGLDLPTMNYQKEKPNFGSSLKDRFIVPPFSIFDTKQGYWQDRKKIWKDLVGDDGESRQNILSLKEMSTINNGVSILDPVLAEIIVKWFAPENANIIDCFAGDTIFGFVSTYENNNTFLGIELREEQSQLNNERTCDRANYICDDGRNIDLYVDEKSKDLLFSCPPYFDLEVYSDDINDASNQETYEDFIDILDTAFSKSIRMLKDDRFAVIVVGDVRNKKTDCYYDFPGDIKSIFKKNGMFLYNDIILSDAIGSASMRANNYMRKRKVVKIHQNVLVFWKGNVKNIPNIFPSLNFDDIKKDTDYDSTDV